MRYLRKTATYKVVGAQGETLFVDEFEAACPTDGTARDADRKLMLRDGEAVKRDSEGMLFRPKTGEKLVILSKE